MWWLLAVVFALASVIVGILYRKVRNANAQLKVKNLELKQQSSRDPLTSLYNRRHFQEFMRTHLHVEKRGVGAAAEDIVGALFLLDVDHFKHVNDTYGHAAGDAVLTMISENLRVILRETDMIVRWGGEEFLAFLPAIPRSGVDEIARRLLAGISAQTIDYQGSKISVNVSIGFAPFPLSPGEHPLPWERAVNLVDMALYMAKGHGRNRAYGVRGFANFGQTSMESIEQDLERAWRAGFVDMSVVLGTWPEPVAAITGRSGQRRLTTPAYLFRFAASWIFSPARSTFLPTSSVALSRPLLASAVASAVASAILSLVCSAESAACCAACVGAVELVVQLARDLVAGIVELLPGLLRRPHRLVALAAAGYPACQRQHQQRTDIELAFMITPFVF